MQNVPRPTPWRCNVDALHLANVVSTCFVFQSTVKGHMQPRRPCVVCGPCLLRLETTMSKRGSLSIFSTFRQHAISLGASILSISIDCREHVHVISKNSTLANNGTSKFVQNNSTRFFTLSPPFVSGCTYCVLRGPLLVYQHSGAQTNDARQLSPSKYVCGEQSLRASAGKQHLHSRLVAPCTISC